MCTAKCRVQSTNAVRRARFTRIDSSAKWRAKFPRERVQRAKFQRARAQRAEIRCERVQAPSGAQTHKVNKLKRCHARKVTTCTKFSTVRCTSSRTPAHLALSKVQDQTLCEGWMPSGCNFPINTCKSNTFRGRSHLQERERVNSKRSWDDAANCRFLQTTCGKRNSRITSQRLSSAVVCTDRPCQPGK